LIDMVLVHMPGGPPPKPQALAVKEPEIEPVSLP
jgi:hypothetical protein